MSSVTVYTLRTCDSCQKAIAWLHSQNIPFEEIPIRETTPPIEALERALKATSNPATIFNRSGADYRELDLKSRIKDLSIDQMVVLLKSNGDLIKRPFVIANGTSWAGFNEVEWSQRFALIGD